MKSRIIVLITALWLGCLSRAVAFTQYTLTVSNIADLQVSLPNAMADEFDRVTPVTAPTALVLGYYTPGDRGGGTFMWDPNCSATPDGGRYIATNGWTSGNGRWVRQLNGETANIKMWGATNDPNISIDSSAQIQRAVNACQDGAFCGELVFPNGSYLLTNTVVFNSGLHMRGEGNNTWIYSQGTNDVFRTRNAQSALTNGPVGWDAGIIFEDMVITMDTNSTGNAGLVLCQPGEASTIRNVVFANGGYGIRVYGAGAPGLQVCDTYFGNSYVAGISVEGVLPNGTFTSAGGGISLFRISGDHLRPDSDATASLVRIYRCTPHCSVYDFKAESSWGGGVFHYYWSFGDTNLSQSQIGTLDINGGSYNCGYSNCDFVVLDSDNDKTASVTIHSVNLYNIRYLIRDDVTPRNIDPNLYDTASAQGLDQALCRLPLQYEADAVASRCVINGSDTVAFVPTTTNAWYRIVADPTGWSFWGRLTISDMGNSSEANIDIDPNAGVSGPLINVTRAVTTGNFRASGVTKMRAGSYYDPSNGSYHCFVDIFVDHSFNLGSSDLDKIAAGCPFENLHWPYGFLTAPTSAYANDPTPPGCTLLSCVTNSLTR